MWTFGTQLRRRIDEGIDGATHFLVLLTPASLQSEWVQTELDGAMVNRISGNCRLIPVLLGVTGNELAATLRGLVWVSLDEYDKGLRQLVDACHNVSRTPPLGSAPAWVTEKPLPNQGLSIHAQRLAAWLNERSEHGLDSDYFDQETLIAALALTAEELGTAASELGDLGFVKLSTTFGCGPAGFSALSPTASLFIATDAVLRGWNAIEDAVALAAAMVNLGEDYASLQDADKLLNWGPRRINPAAEYLALQGLVRPLQEMGSHPYTFSAAAVNHRTRRFVESN